MRGSHSSHKLELGYYTIRTPAEKIYLPFVSPFTPSTENLAVANGLEEATCIMSVNCTVGDIVTCRFGPTRRLKQRGRRFKWQVAVLNG